MSAALSERISRLYKIKGMLGEIMTLLRFRAVTVYELADELYGEYPTLCFISTLARQLERASAFAPVWEDAVKTDKTLMPAEREILLCAGAVLGSCDAQGQLSTLEACRERLSVIITRAEDEKRRKAPLYRGIGLLSGMLISIILI